MKISRVYVEGKVDQQQIINKDYCSLSLYNYFAVFRAT